MQLRLGCSGGVGTTLGLKAGPALVTGIRRLDGSSLVFSFALCKSIQILFGFCNNKNMHSLTSIDVSDSLSE